jgi:sugar lactone lactonase YvrE
MRAEPITGPAAFHGEGPVWWEDWGGLRFVDLFAGDVLTLAADGVERRHVGTVAAALRPRRDGGAVIALERTFALEAPDGALTVLPEVWSDDTIRFNDGGCDPDGRFYCGTMAWDARPGAGSLYRLDRDDSVTLVLDGVTISNGLEWSPDGSHAYYADTPTGQIDVFDYDAASGLTNRRPFAEIASEHGWPDGLTVDADGGVWVALYGGGAVNRYLEGTLDAVVEVPTPKPTACTFGGPGLSTLYVTTTQEDLPPGSDPLAGSLFAVEPGVAGLPARAFTGGGAGG